MNRKVNFKQVRTQSTNWLSQQRQLHRVYINLKNYSSNLKNILPNLLISEKKNARVGESEIQGSRNCASVGMKGTIERS